MSVIPITIRGGTRRPRPATRRVEETALLVRILARSLGGEDAADAANRLMRRFGSVSAAVSADRVELGRASLAPASIADCRLARDLAVALARVEASRQPLVSSWTELIDYLRAALAHAPREQFRTLYLDKKNRLLGDELTADGTVDHAPVYPRELVRRGLELNASALILVHNHPSGDPSPSEADIAMTRRIVEASRALDLVVHDHVVVAREGVFSFRARGLL